MHVANLLETLSWPRMQVQKGGLEYVALAVIITITVNEQLPIIQLEAVHASIDRRQRQPPIQTAVDKAKHSYRPCRL